jgi:hypothetical protein
MTSIIVSGWTIIASLMVRLGKGFSQLGTPSSIRIPGTVREIGDTAFCGLNSLIDLSFEERTVRIGVSAFSGCSKLNKAAFPASLIVIEANVFGNCRNMRQITFAVASELQCIRTKAFSECRLNEIVIPASIMEIYPSAFSAEVWRTHVKFEGPPLFLIDDDFILLIDSRVIFRCLRYDSHKIFAYDSPANRIELLIRWNVEVIGAHAFGSSTVSVVVFESDTRLREIGSGAFAGCEAISSIQSSRIS